MTATRWRIGLASLIGAVALIALARWGARRVGDTDLPPAPPSAPLASQTSVTYADFAGAEACAECHRAQYRDWTRSTHGRAGGPPTRDRIIAPFDGRPIRLRDAIVTPTVTGTGAFIFSVAQRNRPVRVLRVDAVVGGGFMAGGGTQALFSRFPDGTLRFLPFDYSVAEGLWFCQPRRAERGWIPLTPQVALADCGAWPPTRILGSSERFQSCQQCHGSQIDVAADTATGGYHVRFLSLAVNCESCHGPGRRHVELARSGNMGDSAGIGLKSLATLTKDQSLQVCFQCHAAKAALKSRYLPGKPLEEHFALKLPLLLDTAYFADGRTRDFGYQEGHLSSDCYLNGSMTCVDCHEPHGQRYRDVTGSPLPGRLDNGQCLGCHPSKADSVERHTRHPVGSPGSRCVACHMPYLQQPGAGRQIPYARSDHTIPIPRPAYDSSLGIDNACQKCHRDQPVARLQARVSAWYGELKPMPAPVAALLAADTMRDAALAAGAILSVPGSHPMAAFAGLTRIFERYARPDQPERPRDVVRRLEELAASADPDVQALALATLHLAWGTDRPVRRTLADALRRLGAGDGPVRHRWVWILRVRGDAYLAAGDYRNALTAYLRAQEVKPDDPAVRRNLGTAYTRLGDYPAAIGHFRRSLEADPRNPAALVDLGFALMQHGEMGAALEAFEQAIAASPWDPAGYANLGVAHLRRGAVSQAIEALEHAVTLGPGLAAAHFALANAYAAAGQSERAAAAIEHGLEFDPDNAAARQRLEQLRHRP